LNFTTGTQKLQDVSDFPDSFAHVQECTGPCLALKLLTVDWLCVLDSQVCKIAEDFATADSEAFEWGDRRQEIVFIGIGMNQKKIVALLDSCLLTPEEMVTYRSQAAEQVQNSQVPAKQIQQTLVPPEEF
jgi:hypothetical protein